MADESGRRPVPNFEQTQVYLADFRMRERQAKKEHEIRTIFGLPNPFDEIRNASGLKSGLQ